MTNLSFSLEKKKNKLIKQKKLMKWYLYFLVLPSLFSIVLGIYIISFLDRLLYYVFPFFTVNSLVSSESKSQDIIILYIFAISAIATIILYSGYKNLKVKYDALRKNVIKDIDTSLCNCSIPCNCKDSFIKEMEKEKIDLIFE